MTDVCSNKKAQLDTESVLQDIPRTIEGIVQGSGEAAANNISCKEDNTFFSPIEALKAGTIFPALYIPYGKSTQEP